MDLFTFQITAANEIADKFSAYHRDPLLKRVNEVIPFYQNLSSITGSGKTVILAETIVKIRAGLPIEPIILWLSKGRVVVEQTLQNLSIGKYKQFLGNFDVMPLLEAEQANIEDSTKGLILVATAGKFNQKDKELGDRRVFRSQLDDAKDSLWEMIKSRWDAEKRKRPLIIVYDEGHNLSDQQTEILLELNSNAIIAASATARVPQALNKIIERLKDDKEWKDKDLSTVVHSSEVVEAGLIKQNIQLGGYVTPMEIAIDEMLEDMERVEVLARELNLHFSPKAIYVSNTNVVATAIEEDSLKTKFADRQARPIVIWRHLVSKGIDPSEIAVYCNLKFGKDNPAPPEFILFSGGDNDYQKFIAGKYKHIIFNLSLQEGWDDPECYFAYVDKDMKAKDQITQIIGRVLRQPYAKHYADIRLNTAHFYIRTDEKNVFQEVIEEVRKKLAVDTPEVTLTVYQSTGSRKFKPVAKVLKKATVPKINLNTEPAFQAINKILESVLDYNQDMVNTIGQGERLTVLQKVGINSETKEDWVKVAHSNPVTARWVLIKEIQKYYPKALGICAIENKKFDARLEYNSLASEQIRKVAVEIVDAFLNNAEIVQSWTEAINVPEIVVNEDDFIRFQNSVHEGYSGLNELEKPFAEALDKTENLWFRNPSRGFFEIPLLDRGKTKNFNPDFLVWVKKSHLIAIDTKGDHLLKEAAGRKLFHIKKSGTKGAELLIRLVSEGHWVSVDERKSSKGYTVWTVKNGMITPIHANDMEDAVRICLQTY